MAFFRRRGSGSGEEPGREQGPPTPAAVPPLPVPPLPVPPFAPDPPVPTGPAPFAGADPVAVLAAHGVTLPGPVEMVQAATDRPVWTVAVADAASGVELWSAVRGVHERTGLWPVLIDEGFWETTAFVGLAEEPAPVEPVDAARWFTDAATDPQHGLVHYGRGPVPAVPEAPAADGPDRLAGAADGSDHLLLVPSSAGWEVPGRLGWSGAVNQGVEGDEHTAVLRRWHARWGADLLAMGLDTATVRVTRPPTTATDALAVATEMALYCADSVFQGAGTIEALVPMAASDVWSFWWD